MADVGVLGADAVRGDVGGVDAVGAFLRRVSEEVGAVRQGLWASRSTDWEGAAADAFTRLLHQVPHELDRAAASYARAADAVGRYRGGFADARAEAVALAQRLEQAEQALAGARSHESALQRAVDAVERELRAATDPAVRQLVGHRVATAHRSFALAQRGVVEAQDEIDRVRQLAHANRQALDHLARATADELLGAAQQTIDGPHHHWYDGVVHDVEAVGGAILGEAVKIGEAAVKDLVNAVELPAHIIAFIEDPSWDHFNEYLESLQGVLTIVALAGIALAPFTGGTSLALTWAAGLETEGIDAIRLGEDAGRVLAGDTRVTWGMLAEDTATLALDAIPGEDAVPPTLRREIVKDVFHNELELGIQQATDFLGTELHAPPPGVVIPQAIHGAEDFVERGVKGLLDSAASRLRHLLPPIPVPMPLFAD